MRELMPTREWVFTCDLSPEQHQAITQQVLCGRSVAQVAQEARLSQAQVRRIVHHSCLHANPDLYCETMKANAKRYPLASSKAGAEPSLTFLRQHRLAFGCPEALGA